MNALATQQHSQSSGSPELSALTTELGKMLGLVAPVTMSADQQTLWLASAVDALNGIRSNEVQAVSMEVRRSVTRPSQIVPEICRLVAERRKERSRIAAQERELEETRNALPPPKDLMSRRGQPMSETDTQALNLMLEGLGATARYRPDGSRYTIDGAQA